MKFMSETAGEYLLKNFIVQFKTKLIEKTKLGMRIEEEMFAVFILSKLYKDGIVTTAWLDSNIEVIGSDKNVHTN